MVSLYVRVLYNWCWANLIGINLTKPNKLINYVWKIGYWSLILYCWLVVSWRFLYAYEVCGVWPYSFLSVNWKQPLNSLRCWYSKCKKLAYTTLLHSGGKHFFNFLSNAIQSWQGNSGHSRCSVYKTLYFDTSNSS